LQVLLVIECVTRFMIQIGHEHLNIFRIGIVSMFILM